MESVFGFHAEWTPRRVAEDLADHLRFLSRDHLFPGVASSPPYLPPAHRCGVCGADSMIAVLNLGDLPSGPLRYLQCRKCGHIQLAASTNFSAHCSDEKLSTAHYEKVLAHAEGVMLAANASDRSMMPGANASDRSLMPGTNVSNRSMMSTVNVSRRSILVVVSCGEYLHLASLFLKKKWLVYGIGTSDAALEDAF